MVPLKTTHHKHTPEHMAANVYPIPKLNEDGSMAIAMDHFLYVDMAKYTKEVVTKLLCLRPGYKPEAWDAQRQQVNLNHACAQPTSMNILDWRREIKEELFGKKIGARMNDAFNENLRHLMNPGKMTTEPTQFILASGFINPSPKKMSNFCFLTMMVLVLK